jgi:hypothetical protein
MIDRVHTPRDQSASAVLLVRPAAFGFDADTAATNAFQSPPSAGGDEAIRGQAIAEFEQVSHALGDAGVRTLVVDDRAELRCPDAVFPNNWISTHHDGTVVLYPMLAPSRRRERRGDIVDSLRSEFAVRRVVDLSPNEDSGRFLEGTGSLVFDHEAGVVYACLSPRTHRGMVAEIQALLGYEPIVFHAGDAAGREIYHTNVMMMVGTGVVVIAAEAIADAGERRRVLERLRATRRRIIEISRDQLAGFAANALELRTGRGDPLLALSARAWSVLSPDQRESLASDFRIVRVPLPTIESVGGGSLRCMIAEIFLPARLSA